MPFSVPKKAALLTDEDNEIGEDHEIFTNSGELLGFEFMGYK